MLSCPLDELKIPRAKFLNSGCNTRSKPLPYLNNSVPLYAVQHCGQTG